MADIDEKKIASITDTDTTIPIEWENGDVDIRWNNAIAMGIAMARKISGGKIPDDNVGWQLVPAKTSPKKITIQATFILADAETGEIVKQVTEQGIITSAIKRILDPPDCAILYNYNYCTALKNMLPINKTLLGGIVLLGNTIEESTDNVMLTKDCIPIATAGGAYSGTNVMRGSLNEGESYQLENGYHFTWDFAADKANGTIKCAALTSRLFGNTGFANEDSSGCLTLNPENVLKASTTSVKYFNAEGQYVGTFEKYVHTYFKRISGSKNLKFVRLKSLDPTAVGVNDVVDISSYAQPYFSTEVEIPIKYDLYNRWFLNVSTKVLYFFTDAYSDNGQYKVGYAGISMMDFSVADTGTWVLSKTYSSQRATAIYDGKLFVAGDEKVEIFSSSGELLRSYSRSLSPACYFYTVNGVLYFTDGSRVMMAYYNGELYTFRNPNAYSYMYSVDIDPPYYPTAYVNIYSNLSGVSQNPYLGLASSFLSTINNLSEPLEKTNKHTLKVICDIIQT